MADDRVMIIGAGLCGSLLACYLARMGIEVDLYERRPDPRQHGFVGGRSINLALSARGIHALRHVELADEVLKTVIPMPGRMIHSPTGKLTFQAYSSNPDDRINSVSRAGLNILLINAAETFPNVRLHFDMRCISLDMDKPEVEFEDSTASRHVVDTGRVIGADGAYSAVRLHMMTHVDPFDYEQSYLEHGYKELSLPPDSVGEFAIEPNALHIWPRGGAMMIALPNHDHSFTCTLFWPLSGPGGLDSLTTDQQIIEHFQAHYPDAMPMMPNLANDYRENPVGTLVTIRCAPWNFEDKILLIGDAAHGIVPFYGQGMNAAFEDCFVLAECIKSHLGDWPTIFKSFYNERKPNTDAIAEMAVDNFIEMRDHTASRVFRAKKHTEHALHRLLPGLFLPLYNMVSFTTIPYAKARRRARLQSLVLRTCAGVLAVAIALILIAGLWSALS